MTQGRYWSVDELAARKLLAMLELEETEARVGQVARHFAEHRLSIAGWAADRVHAGMVRELEDIPSSIFAAHSEDWARGFRNAEERLLTTSPRDLLEIEPEQSRSQGQILRSMVRQARRS